MDTPGPFFHDHHVLGLFTPVPSKLLPLGTGRDYLYAHVTEHIQFSNLEQNF